MKSKSVIRTSQKMGEIYKVHEFLSESFTINWLFIIDDSMLTPSESRAIKDLYNKSLPILRTSVISFNPLGNSFQIFKEKLEKIKDQNKMVKIAADPQNALKILKNLPQKQLNLISEFYVYSPIGCYDLQRLNLKAQFPQVIIKETIGDVISVASEEIEKWRLKFQILRNLLPLNKTSRQKAYQYRIRLHTCIKLSPNLFDRYLRLFEQYIEQEIESRKLWDQQYENRASKKRNQIINDLRQAILKWKEIEINLKDISQIKNKLKILQEQKDSQNNQAQVAKLKLFEDTMKNNQKKFTQIMLYLYKKETIFYELINNGIKYFQKKQFDWEHLSLPICLLFKAIKLAYKQEPDINKYQFEQIILWRGGKISQRQCQQICKSWRQYPFYQFLSFLSTSKDINIALGFLKQTQRELKKMNCLFKIVIKKPKRNIHQTYSQFFHHGYCSIPNQYGMNNENQVLLNIFTVAKIIDFELITFKKLKQLFKVRKNCMQQKEEHDKIPMITVEVGTFEELFVQDVYSNIREQRQKKQYKEKHKQLIESVMYTIDIIRKYQSFDFANSYQLCNQMEKSYKYLMGQIKQLVQDHSTDQNGKLQLLYSQENYYSRLSDICRKMGRLSQALIYNELAIQKCKQLENIDKNLSFHQYQQKLNAFYLKSSQILIEQHQYSDATKIINERIEHLKSNKDQKQRQRNKVIISRLLLDLGVANFKQGKIDEAKQIFTQSANNVEEIFTFINYDYLNEETFFVDWIKGLLFREDVKWNEGRDVFYERERKKKIQKITEVYGGQERLQVIKKNANSLAVQTTQVIQNHREYFSSNEEYEHIINEVKSKIDAKIKNQEQIPEQILMKKYQEQLTEGQKIELAKKATLKRIENQYQKMKKEMNDSLVFQQKDNFVQIQLQQDNILKQKKKLQNLKVQFWSNPDVYLYDNFEFNKQFDDLWLKKQQINRQKLLKSNNQITMQELTDYYKKNAESLSKYIQQQQQWGYSQSAPKILQQYNRLVKLYIQINCREDAEKTIEQVKRLADIKGQQKYYQLAVAYFLKGKIYQEAAQIDFLTLIDSTTKEKYKAIQQIRHKNVTAALVQFEQSTISFKKALIKEESGKQNIDALMAQPQQHQLKIWRVKSMLTQFDLTEAASGKKQLLSKMDSLLGEIIMDLKYINNTNSLEIKADYLETHATYCFKKKQYQKSLQYFQECLKLRQEKFGTINWQNTLTFIKVINLFYMSDSFRPQLLKYAQNLQKNYNRYKNYPFQWKISLARFYLNKQCEPHKAKDTISLLEYALIAMQKIGFAEQHFYLQYDLIYELQYKVFFNKYSAYLMNRPKIQKKTRKIQSPIRVRQVKQVKKNSENNQMQIQKIRESSMKQKRQLQQDESYFVDFSQTRLMNSNIAKISNNKRHQQKSISLKKIQSEIIALPEISKMSRKKQSYILFNSNTIVDNKIPSKMQSTITKYNSTFYSSNNSKQSSNYYHSKVGTSNFTRRSNSILSKAKYKSNSIKQGSNQICKQQKSVALEKTMPNI